MKLQELSYERRAVQRRPTVSFLRNGKININAEAAKTMNIQVGTFLRILQDAERPLDWYLCISSRDGVMIKADKRGQFNGYHAAIVKTVLESIDREDKTTAIPIGAHPMEVDGLELWPLITKNIK